MFAILSGPVVLISRCQQNVGGSNLSLGIASRVPCWVSIVHSQPYLGPITSRTITLSHGQTRKSGDFTNDASQVIHKAKWLSLRTCYNDHMKYQDGLVGKYGRTAIQHTHTIRIGNICQQLTRLEGKCG